ncbi:MAG: sulfatase-like hydrolase/transferase, partial [Gemmatimonadales bacterium]
SFGLAQGFDEYVDRLDTSGSSHSFAELQRPGAAVAGDAAAWVKEAVQADTPFFLWLHLYDPHTPYAPPKAFADRFPGRPYNGEVAAADWAVGYLLEHLPDTFLDHGIIIATADHGESLGDHGEPEHGIFLYDATLKVPLIIAGAGLPAGAVVSEQVRHVDLLPTLLDLIGGTVPDGLDGESVTALARGESRRDVPSSYAESWFQRLHFGWSELRAVRTGEWKYIEAPRPELYNLRTDAGERKSVVGERARLVGRLAEEVRVLASADATVAAERQIDAATAERLRSLGYIGGSGGTIGGAEGSDPKDRIDEYVDFVARFYRALDRLQAGDAGAALRGFQQLARRYPQSFEPHQYVGRALASLRRHREALAEYEVAIGLSPQSAAIYFDAA